VGGYLAGGSMADSLTFLILEARLGCSAMTALSERDRHTDGVRCPRSGHGFLELARLAITIATLSPAARDKTDATREVPPFDDARHGPWAHAVAARDAGSSGLDSL
jgi:hypothetical protein